MLPTRLLPTRLLPAQPTRSQIYLWLSLLVSLLYSLPALQEAFSSEYVIQDDARQHVFWMRRFLAPDLFPNDLIADYFQSVAPWGYTSLYQLLAWVGLDPVTLSKLLPAVLGWVITIYCFGTTLQILPVPIAGFAAATLLNQNLWMRDDLSSATPGAFFYPIFLAFLYYLLRSSLLPTLATIALQGLFYPQCVFLSAGILLLRLLDWQGRKLRLTPNRAQIRFCLSGLGVAGLVILLYALKSSQFGSVITAAEARPMIAFSPMGWSAFFTDPFVDFWICGKRSGLIPTEWCDLAKNRQEVPQWWLGLLRFPSLSLGLLLPILLKFKARFPLAEQIRNGSLLLQGVVVSLGMFLLAHLLLFRLHLPNRYTEHSFRIFLALAAGMSLIILWDRLLHWVMKWVMKWKPSSQVRPKVAFSSTAILIIVLIIFPYSLEIDHDPFPVTGYVHGKHPAIYKFLEKQPKDIVIASLAEPANQIPTFAQRSLLAGGEGYLLPYHPQYFQEMSRRLVDLIAAQYSPDLALVKAFIRKYGVDFWLLDRESFQPDFDNPKSYLTSLFQQFPEQTEPIKAQIQSGSVPALSRLTQVCSAVNKQGLTILKSRCILKQ